MEQNDDESWELFRLSRSEDQIGAVIRAHLWVESNLNKILTYKTQKDWSNKIFGKRFDYLDKLRVATVFGLIPTDLFQPLQALAELRNDSAHKTGYTLTEERQEKFLSKIPKVYLRNLENALSKSTNEEDVERGTECSNVRHLAGLKGRPAVSYSFVLAVFALVYELWCKLHDFENADIEMFIEELDENEQLF